MLFSHEFLPQPLLGRDILSKVHASVFMNIEPSLSLPLVKQNVNPRIWADGKSVGRTLNAIPMERRGTSSGIALRHLSHPWLHVRSAKDHIGRETALRGVGLRGRTLKTIRTEGTKGSPHKLPS